MTKTSRCRSCGAEIWWLTHARTKKKSPINVAVDPAGDVVVDHEAGEFRIALPDAEDSSDRHTTHFANCPEAKNWRRRRE